MAQETLEPGPPPAPAADQLGPARFLKDDRILTWGGALLALLIGAALFSRFGIDGNLWRDETVYAYAGQQLADGVPFYVSIFDPKPPLAPLLAALGVLSGRAVGADEINAMRVEFFVFACLTVVAIYFLALWLFRSRLAGLVSAAVFASFKGFAYDALAGPDAKTPGIFFSILSMGLLVRRHWFWGAFVGSLAGLVWQPLVAYAGIAVLWALLASDRVERWRNGARALGGAAIPVVVLGLYYLIKGAAGKLVQASLIFPLTGVQRGSTRTPFDYMLKTLGGKYRDTRILFWAGTALLVAMLVWRVLQSRGNLRGLARDPYVVIVMLTFLGIAVFSLLDFQGYPDLFPLLPYAALGFGGAAAFVVARISAPRARRVATAVSLVAVAALVGITWSNYSNAETNALSLPAERANADKLERILGPDGTLYALGDPTPLVLTGRRNPNRYIYLRSGVDRWVIKHTRGGIAGWKAQIGAADAEVVVVGEWGTKISRKIKTYLKTIYGPPAKLGIWWVFVKPQLHGRAKSEGLTF
jgi:hypothetical protein